MKKLSILTLVFAVLFFVFLIGLVFLRIPFGAYPLMSLQDVIDIITPLVFLPLYLLLYRFTSGKALGFPGMVVFIIFAGLWAAGQGMHLSANSIANLLNHLGTKTGDIYQLTYFYDELLGHYLWHIGIVGLSALLIYRQWKNPVASGKTLVWPLILGGIIYGFSYFLIILEGNTASLGVTFSVLAVLFSVIWARRRISHKPIVIFFLVGYALAVLLFIIWGVINGGLVPVGEVIKY